jgi:hypothetical protein
MPIASTVHKAVQGATRREPRRQKVAGVAPQLSRDSRVIPGPHSPYHESTREEAPDVNACTAQTINACTGRLYYAARLTRVVGSHSAPAGPSSSLWLGSRLTRLTGGVDFVAKLGIGGHITTCDRLWTDGGEGMLVNGLA